MYRMRILPVSNFLLVILSILAISSDGFALNEKNDFKIGMAVCLSGPCAVDGKGALEGAQLAADEINASGGVLGRRIVFKTQDSSDAVSASKAVLAFEQLHLDPDITFFIGPSWTPGGLALVPILAKNQKVIMTSPSIGIGDFHRAGRNVFNARGVDEAPTRKAARDAYQAGWRRAAIVSSQQPWEAAQAQYFQDEFEKLGGTIVAKVEPVPTATSLSTEALQIVASKPDGVFLSVYVQMGIIAKELRKLKFTGRKFAAFIDATRLAEADGALEGTRFYSFITPSAEFANKFRGRFGHAPEIPAAASYDTIYAYAKGIESAKTFEIKEVQESLHQVDFEGSSGRVQFDSEGCAKREVELWQVEAGAFKRIG